MTVATAAVVGLAGAAIGAGGSVAGAYLSRPDQPKSYLPPSFSPAANPLEAINLADLLASQGYYQPAGTFGNAGPLQQAIQAFRATPFKGGAGPAFITNLQNLYNNFAAGGHDPNSIPSAGGNFFLQGANQVANAGGFGDYASLFAAQKQYEDSVSQQNPELQQIANLNAQTRLASIQGLNQIAQNPLDFNSIRDQELARINRQLDLQQTSMLRAASTGGYNPGGGLTGIAQLRQSADLDAISRAVGALQGQSQSIANLNALNPANRAQQLGPGVLANQVPSIFGQQQFVNQVQNPFGAGVAQGANILGGTATGFAQSQYNNAAIINMINASKPGMGGYGGAGVTAGDYFGSGGTSPSMGVGYVPTG